MHIEIQEYIFWCQYFAARRAAYTDLAKSIESATEALREFGRALDKATREESDEH